MTNLVPKTFSEILAFLDAADQGLVATTPEQMAATGAALVAKVDDTNDFIDEMEYQAERLRVASAKLAEGKRQILSRVDRLKDYMAHHMKEKAFSQIPGELWKVRLTKSESVDPKSKAPTKADVDLYPQFVRTKYEWDKEALGEALCTGDVSAQAVAAFAPSYSVKFEANKGKLR